MPISIKFSTGVGSMLLMANPMPAEASNIRSITVRAPRAVFAFCISLPARKPVAMPMNTGRNTRKITTPTGTPAVET